MAKNMSPKNLLMYIGLVLVLAGTIAGKGEDMIVILFGAAFILLLEAVEFRQIPPRNGVVTQIILSGALLIVGIIKLVESVGKNFTAHHLYLMMILIGLVLILIDDLKRYPAIPEG